MDPFSVGVPYVWDDDAMRNCDRESSDAAADQNALHDIVRALGYDDTPLSRLMIELWTTDLAALAKPARSPAWIRWEISDAPPSLWGLLMCRIKVRLDWVVLPNPLPPFLKPREAIAAAYDEEARHVLEFCIANGYLRDW